MFDVAAAFYPNDILKVTDRDWEEMEQLIRSPQIKVVGEIGMDYYPYENPVPKEMQKQAFIRQMRLANELGKPAGYGGHPKLYERISACSGNHALLQRRIPGYGRFPGYGNVHFFFGKYYL